MTTTIAKFCKTGLTITAAPGDSSTTIAHLAQATEFDPRDAKRWGTAAHCIAFDALRREYKAWEMTGGDTDYHDGFHMTFRDGSEIRFHA